VRFHEKNKPKEEKNKPKKRPLKVGDWRKIKLTAYKVEF
jgi:hypothetical protein